MLLCKHQVTVRYHCSVTSPPDIPGRTGSCSRKYASRTLLSCIPMSALSVKLGQVREVRGGKRNASRRKTVARSTLLTCRARLSNEYVPSANFRPLPRRGEANAASSRVQWVTRSCTPTTNTLNMHEVLHPIRPVPATGTYILELDFAYVLRVLLAATSRRYFSQIL